MMEGESEVFKAPLGVSADEVGEDKVRVNIVIPGLNVKTKFFKPSTKPANAVIEPPTYPGNRGFCVIVRVQDKDKGPQNYKALIKKLPAEIDPDKCSFEVKQGQVILYLQKKVSKSWAAKMSERGLEQAEDDEEMEEEMT